MTLINQKTTFVTRTQTIHLLAKAAIQCLLTSHTPAVPQRNKAAKVIAMNTRWTGYGEAEPSKRPNCKKLAITTTRYQEHASTTVPAASTQLTLFVSETEVQAAATNETVEQAIELLRSIDVVFAA